MVNSCGPDSLAGSSYGGGSRAGPVVRVGCVLSDKKAERYLTPTMLQTAACHGLQLVPIAANDSWADLDTKGPFDVIVHKISPLTGDWEHRLQEHQSIHPHVKVVDEVAKIRKVHSRATMLSPLEGDGLVIQGPSASSPSSVRVCAPSQIQVDESTTFSQATEQLAGKGLAPPLLVKPLVCDGTPGSHSLAIIHSWDGLATLLDASSPARTTLSVTPPAVIQPFVEHGGVMYKVYVLGSKTVAMYRPSIKTSTLRHLPGGLQQLPRVSCKHQYSEGDAELRDLFHVCTDSNGPPQWMLTQLAMHLRTRLGMQLFNFDMLCPTQQTNPSEHLYYVIDINYFPGVNKLPGFEQLFVNLMLEVHNEHPLAGPVNISEKFIHASTSPRSSSCGTSPQWRPALDADHDELHDEVHVNRKSCDLEPTAVLSCKCPGNPPQRTDHCRQAFAHSGSLEMF